MAAYAEARSLYPDATNFTIVSVGTGDRQDSLKYAQAKEWGLVGWASHLVSVLMDSVSESVDYQLQFLPGCAWYRLQVPNLQAAQADMDNVDPQNLANLQQTANGYVRSVSADIDQICGVLKEGRGSDMPGIGHPLAKTVGNT
jgi:hypothetical protein